MESLNQSNQSNQAAHGIMEESTINYRPTKLEQLYTRRNHLEAQLQRLNKQIELMNQNPIIARFFELDK